MTESNVVIATPEWEDGIWNLLLEMHRETALFPLVEDKARMAIRRGLHRDKSIIGVIGTPSKVEASIGLYMGCFWYSDKYHIEDFWQYVGQPYRKSGHATAIVHWAMKVGDMMGAPVLLGVMSQKRTDPKIRFYERKMGPESLIGAIFVHGLEDKAA